MATTLDGLRVAVLAADGVERVELEEPRRALQDAGARTVNPDKLRMDTTAVGFVRDFVESGKPVASICHGPWTLVEAGVVSGRRLTSWPSVRTDLRNAGAEVVDEEVVTDGNLTTSRSPDDLPAFCERIVEQFATAAPDTQVGAN
jgi:protease I